MRYVNFESLKDSYQLFNNQRKQFTFSQKMMVDQYEFVRASNLMNKGLYMMCHSLRKMGVIRDVNEQHSMGEDIANNNWD